LMRMRRTTRTGGTAGFEIFGDDFLTVLTNLGRFLIHENPPFIVGGGRWLRMIGKPSSFWATTCWR
jgi:hypothetical protein